MVIFLILPLPDEIVLGTIIFTLKLFHIFIFGGVFSHSFAPPEIALEAMKTKFAVAPPIPHLLASSSSSLSCFLMTVQ